MRDVSLSMMHLEMMLLLYSVSILNSDQVLGVLLLLEDEVKRLQASMYHICVVHLSERVYACDLIYT